MARTEILTKYYSLHDNPFEPEQDAPRKINFKQSKLSLMRELKMFEQPALKNYFVKVGSFKIASAEVESFLDSIGYNGSPVPPAILVQGAKGTGMDSMAQYVALAIRDRAPGATLSPVPIPSASQPRLLILIKGALERFLPDGKEVFARYDKLIDPRRPDLAFLKAMLQELATGNIPDQPLILTLNSIAWDSRDWLLWLYTLLSPLNVFLVFFSDDTRVASWFDDLVAKGLLPGRSLRLKGLDAGEGKLFLELRFDDFRAMAVAPKTFPFSPAALPLIFQDVPEQRVGVKFLLQILRNSLNAKIAALEKSYADPPPPPPSIQIEWLDISGPYEAILSRKAPTP
jgi:hypothetical protein